LSTVHLVAVDADRSRVVGGSSGEAMGFCRRLLSLKNQKPTPTIKRTSTTTPNPIPMAVPVSRCVVGSVPILPAGAKGAAGLTVVLHIPPRHVPLLTQSLSAEQMLWIAVEEGRVFEEVALGVGVAVSTSRVKARRGMEDIIIKEREIKNVCSRVLYTQYVSRI